MWRNSSQILCPIFIFFIFNIAHCQYSNSTKVSFSVNDGLPSTTCYDIIQDDNGFIWIATEGGLVQYDGTKFKTLTTSDGLPDNEIVRLEYDDIGRLWLQSLGKLSYYYNGKVYTIGDESENQVIGNLNYIRIDTENILLNNNYKIYEISNHSILKRSKVMEALCDGPEPTVVGAYNDTLYMIDSDNVYKIYDNQVNDVFKEERLKATSFYYRNLYSFEWPLIYFSRGLHLYKYNVITHEVDNLITTKDKINSIYDNRDYIWILTKKSIYRFDKKRDNEIVKVMDLDYIASKMIIDKSKNLWVVAYKDGVHMYPLVKEGIENIDLSSYSSNVIESVIYNDNKLILGTMGADFVEMDRHSIYSTYLGSDEKEYTNRIVDIVAIDKDQYLISTDRNLVYKNKNETRSLIYGPMKNIFYKKPNIIINISTGIIRSHIDSLLDESKKERHYLNLKGDLEIISNLRSYSSFIDNQGILWTGGVADGLIKHDENPIYYKSLSPIFSSTISRIDQLDNGVIGVSTKGEGLILIQDYDFIKVDVSKGLTSNFCYDLVSDGNRFFVATNAGISILEVDGFDDENYSISTIGHSQGLRSNEILDIDYYNDTLAVGTSDGLALINIKNYQSIQAEQKVVIDEVLIDGVPTLLQNSISLSPEQNNLNIHFVSPNFDNSRKLKYRYRLQGIGNEEWVSTFSNEVNYNELSPGTYAFQIGLDNNRFNEGVMVDQELHIIVKPNFSETWIFKILFLVLGLGAFYIIYHSFSNRIQKKKLEKLVVGKTKELQEKMKALEKTNDKLESSNKELEQFAFIASHDLKEPVNTIMAYSEILEKRLAGYDSTVETMISFIASSGKRMKEQINGILTYSRIGKAREMETISVNDIIRNVRDDMSDNIGKSNAIIEFGMLPIIYGHKQEIYSLFYNLISNAIKFRNENATPIVNIKHRDLGDAHEFRIRDNGIGIEMSKISDIFNIFHRLHNRETYEGTGIGLSKCRKIVELHKGEIWVESKLGEGSTFIFTLKKYE